MNLGWILRWYLTSYNSGVQQNSGCHSLQTWWSSHLKLAETTRVQPKWPSFKFTRSSWIPWFATGLTGWLVGWLVGWSLNRSFIVVAGGILYHFEGGNNRRNTQNIPKNVIFVLNCFIFSDGTCGTIEPLLWLWQTWRRAKRGVLLSDPLNKMEKQPPRDLFPLQSLFYEEGFSQYYHLAKLFNISPT